MAVRADASFDDYAIMLIAQEDGSGHRTLNDAVRMHPDGRIEQLGWPRVRDHLPVRHADPGARAGSR